MDSRRALELIDAHLDGEPLSEAEADALTDWIQHAERHAEDAFRRIYLHAYLRHHLQALASMPAIAGETIALPRPRIVGPAGPSTFPSSLSRWLPAGILGLLVAAITCAMMLPPATPLSAARQSHPFAYESFDYPAHPIPRSDEDWPSAGGLNGLDGGHGFAEPWRETGSLVAIIEANPADHPWKPHDLRQFGTLGYSDRFGTILACRGNQLRTSAGPSSMTRRKLDVSTAPDRLRDGDTLGVDGSVLWISFLAQSFDSSGAGRYAYVQLGRDDAGLRIGKLRNVPSGNWSAAAVTDNAEINVRASDKPSGEGVLVVARIDFRFGPEQATIWINPDLTKEPAMADSTLRLPVPDFRLDTLSICGRYSTDFDEIRLGGTFADVTPIVEKSAAR